MLSEGGIRWGIAIPQIFLDGHIDIESTRNTIQRAEELGYDSLWVQERMLGDAPTLEAIGLLCYAAALTQRVRLGTGVVLAPLRNPIQFAKVLSTLDQLSNGRLVLGVGLGWRETDYPIFGLPVERRVHRYVELIKALKTLWTQPYATSRGEFWTLDGTQMEPKTVQKPHPPIWFGGAHPAALRRAVRLGDGWMGANGSIAQFKEQVGIIKHCLEAQGRDPSTFTIANHAYISVDDDPKRAERRLQEWFAGYYRYQIQIGRMDDKTASRVGVYGNPSQCAERLSQMVEAGAQLVFLNPGFDHEEHVERLAQEVIPQVRTVDRRDGGSGRDVGENPGGRRSDVPAI